MQLAFWRKPSKYCATPASENFKQLEEANREFDKCLKEGENCVVGNTKHTNGIAHEYEMNHLHKLLAGQVEPIYQLKHSK